MKTLRKPLSIAVTLALLSASALAEDSSVTIYGTLLPFFDNIQTRGASTNGTASLVAPGKYTGTNQPSMNRLGAGTSNIGFRGSEDLGGGLKAIWQIENSVNVDNGGTAPPPSVLANRNSRVGLQGDWGTLFAGNWDTPYKLTQIDIGGMRGLNPFDNAVVNNPGFAVPGTTTQSGRVAGAADAAFSRRQGNSLQYWTPNFNGLSGRFDYSMGEQKSNATATTAGINPTLFSASLTYANGPISLRYGYEQHKDYFGMSQLGGSAGATLSNSSSKDVGHTLVGVYQQDATRLALMIESLEYKNDDATLGANAKYRRTAWSLLAQQGFGPHGVWLQYGQANSGNCSKTGGAACSTDGLGATQWTLGYKYVLSKRTELYSAYYGMDNERSASYSPVGSSVAPGADFRGLGFGIQHSF